MNFVQNILWNSVEGFVEAGTRTAGGYAGDALIKAGDMIENSGRSIGNGIERRASNYGSAIGGQTYQPSPKALPSTARKPAIKRSNSSPAATKSIGPTSKTPIGAKKQPAAGVTGAAKKQITAGTTAGKGVVGGAQKGLGGVVGGAQKTIGSGIGAAKASPKALPKPYPNNIPYGTSTTPSAATSKAKGQAASGLNAAKGTVESKKNNLPSPYPSSSFPAAERKTAVRPGQSKPFKAPEEKKDEKKPYPGTNTLPGEGKKTPVRAQKYKPAERLGPQVEKGKMQHITV